MTPRRRTTKRDRSNLAGLRIGLYCRVSVSDPGNPDDREKSTQQQEAVGRRWAEQHDATIVDLYSDEGISASRFSKKERAEFNRLMRDVESGRLEGIWFWEMSRVTRQPKEFWQLQELCRDRDVVWVNRDRVVDPADYKDMLAAGILSQVDSVSSEQTSERILRDVEANAQAGRPHGPVTYGYRRVYDDTTRQLIRQEPDTWDGNGRPVEDSPAFIVREVIRRVAAGGSLTGIARDLDDRGIPLPRGGRTARKPRWHNITVRRIAVNPAYIGKRTFRGEILPVEAIWPPLVDEETFWLAHNVLTDGARKQTRSLTAKHLLTMIVSCGKCGGPVVGSGKVRRYACIDRGCASIGIDALDDYVEEIMLRWLSDPDVYADLTRVDDSALATQARADAAQARAELAQWRQSVEKGEITVATAAAAEKGLLARIDEAEARARTATVPAPLVSVIGPDAEARWRNAPLDVKRQMIRTVADITLKPNPLGRNSWYKPHVAERVDWQVLIGPTAGEVITALPPKVRLLASDTRALGELVSHDGPLLQTKLDQRLGMGDGTCRAVVRRLVARGWVTREHAPRDGAGGGRTFLLSITDAGRQALVDAG